MAALAQELRHVLGGLDRERVDDARAGQLGEPGREPAEPLGRRAQLARPRGAGSPGRASRAGPRRLPGGEAPSCSVTSTTTRSFAVAVVASTGMPGGSSAISARSRR